MSMVGAVRSICICALCEPVLLAQSVTSSRSSYKSSAQSVMFRVNRFSSMMGRFEPGISSHGGA